MFRRSQEAKTVAFQVKTILPTTPALRSKVRSRKHSERKIKKDRLLRKKGGSLWKNASQKSTAVPLSNRQKKRGQGGVGGGFLLSQIVALSLVAFNRVEHSNSDAGPEGRKNKRACKEWEGAICAPSPPKVVSDAVRPRVPVTL